MTNQNNKGLLVQEPKRVFVYFSQLIGKTVLDRNGVAAGYLYDIIVKPTQVYPQSSQLVIKKGYLNRRYAIIDWEEVKDIDAKELRLNIEKTKLDYKEKQSNREALTLRRDILDQQVVDTANHKVIRVNDIHLLEVENNLMIAHVDISSRGLIRRLGFEKIVDFIIGILNKNSDYLSTEHLISWKHIQPLSINPVSMTIKVNFEQKQLNRIPAADLAEIFLDLSMQNQIALFKSLDTISKAKIFRNIDFRTQQSLVEELNTKEAVEILNVIPPDETTDFLEKLPRDATERFLSLMESKQSKKLSQLLGYSSDSAGGLMTPDYISCAKDTTVESALKQIKERVFKVEPAQLVYIVDEQNHLIGSTNFRRLILANPQEPIQNTSFPKARFVHLDSSVKEIAYLMDKYRYYAIPVVDDNNVMQGIVTVDDVLSQVISIAWRRLKRTKVQ